MTFSDLLHAVRQQPDSVIVPSDWAQGRAGYGGLMAALLFEAMRAKVPADRPVRSLAISFVAPAQTGMPISFEVELLRAGKSVVSVLGRAVQEGGVVTMIQGSFGAPRVSEVNVPSLPATEMKSLEQATALPYIKGVTPEYIQHLDMRWGIGALPYTNTPARQMGGWMRLRGEVPKEPMTEAHLLALVDTWPPAVLPYLKTPAAGSTLAWTIEFVQPVPSMTTHDWCRYCATVEYARDGYGHTAAAVWTAEGALLAISRQTVTVFA
ncbi:acyl-CoA thioesterase [Pseudomonas abieticivorans]|uniref:acyl-CoA thioesterase n=1 Tax=Pseudomonas abieticivorans TaxID=2931382 RepID=UPI0020BF97E4|nr:thioesterase family protein [Pseudomonas sp. PIA16]